MQKSLEDFIPDKKKASASSSSSSSSDSSSSDSSSSSSDSSSTKSVNTLTKTVEECKKKVKKAGNDKKKAKKAKKKLTKVEKKLKKAEKRAAKKAKKKEKKEKKEKKASPEKREEKKKEEKKKEEKKEEKTPPKNPAYMAAFNSVSGPKVRRNVNLSRDANHWDDKRILARTKKERKTFWKNWKTIGDADILDRALWNSERGVMEPPHYDMQGFIMDASLDDDYGVNFTGFRKKSANFKPAEHYKAVIVDEFGDVSDAVKKTIEEKGDKVKPRIVELNNEQHEAIVRTKFTPQQVVELDNIYTYTKQGDTCKKPIALPFLFEKFKRLVRSETKPDKMDVDADEKKAEKPKSKKPEKAETPKVPKALADHALWGWVAQFISADGYKTFIEKANALDDASKIDDAVITKIFGEVVNNDNEAMAKLGAQITKLRGGKISPRSMDKIANGTEEERKDVEMRASAELEEHVEKRKGEAVKQAEIVDNNRKRQNASKSANAVEAENEKQKVHLPEIGHIVGNTPVATGNTHGAASSVLPTMNEIDTTDTKPAPPLPKDDSKGKKRAAEKPAAKEDAPKDKKRRASEREEAEPVPAGQERPKKKARSGPAWKQLFSSFDDEDELVTTIHNVCADSDAKDEIAQHLISAATLIFKAVCERQVAAAAVDAAGNDA